MSLNVTAGLLVPSERRLSANTQRAVEVAARVLEGATAEEALRDARRTWTGSLAEDHQTALDLVRDSRDALLEENPCFSPDQLAELMEIAEDNLLDLMRLHPPEAG